MPQEQKKRLVLRVFEVKEYRKMVVVQVQREDGRWADDEDGFGEGCVDLEIDSDLTDQELRDVAIAAYPEGATPGKLEGWFGDPAKTPIAFTEMGDEDAWSGVES